VGASPEITEGLAAVLAQRKRAAAADRCGAGAGGGGGGTRQRLQQKLVQRKQAAKIAQLQELTGDSAAPSPAPSKGEEPSPPAVGGIAGRAAAGGGSGGSGGGGGGGGGDGADDEQTDACSSENDVIDLTDGLQGVALGGGGGGAEGRGEEDVGGDSLALAWLSQKHRHAAGPSSGSK
jgi:hypothetical protein